MIESDDSLLDSGSFFQRKVREMRDSNMLRSYSTIGRATAYARTLKARFPEAEFVVVLSPFQSYAFRWLIKVQRGSRHIVGGCYVGR